MITIKEIIEKLPNNSNFREWFLNNAKVLVKDINSFFDKFKGDKVTIESVKPLLSWSIVIPKEYKMNLLNTLARLKGQQVLASYGVKNKTLNKVITEAIKENKDIKASDEVKSYLKVNFNEFYKELFDTLSSYETLGTKSAEPIAKIITLKLGAEKGRTIKFCEEFKAYLVKFLKNVIDSINNTMKNFEKPVTASSESIEDILRNILNDVTKEASSICSSVDSSFSVNDFTIYGEISLSNLKDSSYKISFKWSKDKVNTNLLEFKNELGHDLKNNTFSIRDFEGLKKELLDYVNIAKVELNSEKVIESPKATSKEVSNSDIIDICKVILNGNYPNDLKSNANLYLSLYSVKDVNTQYMTTLADSIISKYKSLCGIDATFNNDILNSLKLFLGKFNFDEYLNKKVGETEVLVCFKDGIEFSFYLRYIIGGTVIMCHANCVNCSINSDYMVQVSDKTTTMAEVECWIKSILPEFRVTASKKKTKWTRAEIVKFAQKNNGIEITSFEEYRKINNSLYLESIGYAKDINGNCIGRLWQDKKSKKYYYCTHMGTLMMI